MNTKIERELLYKPGDTISETLEFMKMSQVELADRMGKTPSKINDIITGKEPITTNTALQLEKVLGIEAQFWLTGEANYREKLTRIEQEELLSQAKGWISAQPVKELKKGGYINEKSEGPDLVEDLLKFYGVAGTQVWENFYHEQLAAADFRKSFTSSSKKAKIAAWLRIGEIEHRKLQLPAYDKEEFKNCLIEVKKIVRNHPEDFAEKVKVLCFAAGVAVIYSMNIKEAPISGAARWIGGNPNIQLTDRHKTNDHFWFTFFHEAGHILLHGKKEIFIEDFEGENQIQNLNEEKENDANNFARKWLIGENIDSNFGEHISEKDIRMVARKLETHPGVLLGYLQHQHIVEYKSFNELKMKISLGHSISRPSS